MDVYIPQSIPSTAAYGVLPSTGHELELHTFRLAPTQNPASTEEHFPYSRKLPGQSRLGYNSELVISYK